MYDFKYLRIVVMRKRYERRRDGIRISWGDIEKIFKVLQGQKINQNISIP